MLKVRKLVRETVAKNKARANIVEAYEASNLNNGLEDVDIMVGFLTKSVSKS